mmetsp:Transcript_18028/g.42982  ORF Transcript_18028/g.42982 Transcript_18028/m.42982 type:complete len:102 (+) Transcript_18028:408-713(+)
MQSLSAPTSTNSIKKPSTTADNLIMCTNQTRHNYLSTQRTTTHNALTKLLSVCFQPCRCQMTTFYSIINFANILLVAMCVAALILVWGTELKQTSTTRETS